VAFRLSRFWLTPSPRSAAPDRLWFRIHLPPPARSGVLGPAEDSYVPYRSGSILGHCGRLSPVRNRDPHCIALSNLSLAQVFRSIRKLNPE